MNYKKLSKEIHKNAVSKGFWKTDSNQDEKFMLILTELGEAVEAHRKDKFAKVQEFHNSLDAMDEEDFTMLFHAHIKDTVEDEFADVVIRCLDYLERYKKGLYDIYSVNFEWSANFAENILKTIRDNIDYDVPYIISYVESLCKEYDIDLEWHIEQKMKYNATREKLHGKLY